jgi:hypothetical protein
MTLRMSTSGLSETLRRLQLAHLTRAANQNYTQIANGVVLVVSVAASVSLHVDHICHRESKGPTHMSTLTSTDVLSLRQHSPSCVE